MFLRNALMSRWSQIFTLLLVTAQPLSLSSSTKISGLKVVTEELGMLTVLAVRLAPWSTEGTFSQITGATAHSCSLPKTRNFLPSGTSQKRMVSLLKIVLTFSPRCDWTRRNIESTLL